MHDGKVSSRALGLLAPKNINTTGSTRGSSLPTSLTKLRKRVSSEPLPPEQPRVVIPYSHWRRRYDKDTRVVHIPSRFHLRASESHLLRPRKNYIHIFRSPLPRPKLVATAPTGRPPLGSRKLQQQKPIYLLYLAKRTPHPPTIPWRQTRSQFKGGHRETPPIRWKHLLFLDFTKS